MKDLDPHPPTKFAAGKIKSEKRWMWHRLCGAGVRAGSWQPLLVLGPRGSLGAHGSGQTTSWARCQPLGAPKGELLSHRTAALALLGWAWGEKAGFGVLAWGTAAVEGCLHPSNPWLMFSLHLAQDVSAAQGTAASALPLHGLAGPWCSFSITLGSPAWGAARVLLEPGHGPPLQQGPTGASPD